MAPRPRAARRAAELRAGIEPVPRSGGGGSVRRRAGHGGGLAAVAILRHAPPPGTFLWNRWMDGALGLADPAAFDIRMQSERWALDEVPLAGRLIHQMVDWLYRENRFQNGTLADRQPARSAPAIQKPAGARRRQSTPTRSARAPRSSRSSPRMTGADARRSRRIRRRSASACSTSRSSSAGRRAHAEVWPRIAAWIEAHATLDEAAPPRMRATSDVATATAHTAAHARPARAPRALPASPRPSRSPRQAERRAVLRPDRRVRNQRRKFDRERHAPCHLFPRARIRRDA